MATSAPKLSDPQIEHIADLFAALAEKSRLLILRALMDEPHTVGELADVTGLKQPNVSRQLAILNQARVVTGERDGNFIRYHLSDPLVPELCKLVCSKIVRDSKALLGKAK